MKSLPLVYACAVVGWVIFLAGCTTVGSLQGTPPGHVPQPNRSPLVQTIPSLPPTCPPDGAREHCFFVPTSLPDQGVRVSPSTRLTLVEEAATPSPVCLFRMALSGDTLVGAANESGQIKLYAVDLNSGQMRLIGTSNPGVEIIRISGRYVVWDRNSSDIFAYDLLLDKKVHIAPGIYPDVSDNIVVWVDTRDFKSNAADIYGYDLSRRLEFPVIVRPGRQTQPKIAGPWVAYLEIVAEMDYRLRVHHIQTGEDFEIGTVPVFLPPSSLVAADYFALSENRLAWVSAQNSTAVHLYDLNTRIDRIVIESERTLHDILLDGDILLCDGGKIGYDVALNVSFSIPPMGGEWLGAGSSPLLLSGDRLVWTMEKDTDQIRHLFTARIVRDQ